MTAPILEKGKRLHLLELEVRRLRKAIPEAIQLRVDLALALSTTRRLIGENDAMRRNEQKLKDHIAELNERMRKA